MYFAREQLPEETAYPHLTEFLRRGGIIEIGYNASLHSFANARRGTKTVTTHSAYRDLAEVLQAMDSLVRDSFEVGGRTPAAEKS
jgi:hypothetical protein